MSRKVHLSPPSWGDLTNKQAGNVIKHWIPESLDKLLVMPSLPTRLLIPAFRRITKDSNVSPKHGGLGIIEELGKLQNPSHSQQDKKLRFDSINKFAQDVIGDDNLQLDIPRSEETINIHANGRTLPIESLGTGIHQVIIHAAEATVAQNQIICIEEPENGLYHKLLENLATEFRSHASTGKNAPQIFITTHQPYFVDALSPEETWILDKGEDGFSTICRASDDPIVKSMVEEGLPLGSLWYSDYLDAR